MSSPGPFYRWRPHPWHGLETGPEPPRALHAYIEITPFDLVKYELDKATGYLRVDRPQRSTSQVPCLYGFVPRTYCASRVARLMSGADHGDADPLDICVVSERPIDRSEVIADLPQVLVERVRHYFSTYKLVPGGESDVVLGDTYGRAHAEAVVEAAIADYNDEFGAGPTRP
jgi:inorganic pyrophosphatase